MKEVIVVQPYVPGYRVPFFNRVQAIFARRNLQLKVIAGAPSGDQALRADSATAEWLTTVDRKVVSLFGRSIDLSLSAPQWRNSASAVIMPLVGTSPYVATTLMRRADVKVGVWGHVASYVAPGHPIDLAIERWMMKRADRVLAYTPSGANFAVRQGVNPQSVTTVMNSIDTSEIETARRALVVDGSVSATNLGRPSVFDASLAGRPQKYFAFVGGIDATKRIGLLVESLDILWRRKSPVRILIAGEGAEKPRLVGAASRGQVGMVGHVSGAAKAELLCRSVAIVNPGRIGLVAVDALAARVPILTTTYPFHAPEFEYLSPGTSVLSASEDSRDFADLLDEYWERPPAISSRMDESNWLYPTIDDMAENFTRGVFSMIGGDRDA